MTTLRNVEPSLNGLVEQAPQRTNACGNITQDTHRCCVFCSMDVSCQSSPFLIFCFDSRLFSILKPKILDFKLLVLIVSCSLNSLIYIQFSVATDLGLADSTIQHLVCKISASYQRPSTAPSPHLFGNALLGSCKKHFFKKVLDSEGIVVRTP